MVSISTRHLIDGNLFDLLGLQALSDQRKNELLSRMTEVVQDRVSDRVFDALSADDRASFENLIEQNASPDDVRNYLQAKIPEFQEIIAEETLRFKAQMVQDAAVVRKIAAHPA